MQPFSFCREIFLSAIHGDDRSVSEISYILTINERMLFVKTVILDTC